LQVITLPLYLKTGFLAINEDVLLGVNCSLKNATIWIRHSGVYYNPSYIRGRNIIVLGQPGQKST
jgi:hypothetical protein